MTYSGNLVGFNKAGIKALSRSLNVQVPFTEATLFVSKIVFNLPRQVDIYANFVGLVSNLPIYDIPCIDSQKMF